MAFKPPIMLKINNSCDLKKSLDLSNSLGMSSIITKLSSDLFKREFLDEEVASNHLSFSRNALAFKAATYYSKILPMIEISSLMDSTSEEVQTNYEERILTDINYGFHLKQCGSLYIKSSCKPETLGKLLKKALKGKFFECNFIVEVDLTSKQYFQQMHFKNAIKIPDTWSHWDEICKASNYDSRIKAGLVLSSDIPDDKHAIFRWLGESVALLLLPYTCFVSNSINFPVLSPQNQTLFKLYTSQFKCPVALECKELDKFKVSNYRDYLRHFANLQKSNSYNDHFMVQFPMQPLRDDLDFAIYETFELDKAKYSLYQQAIEAALIEMVSEEEIKSKKVVVLIVGAGRGPLVRAAFNASERTNRKIKVIVVEKNRCAVNTLLGISKTMWKDKEIKIIAKDMRKIDLEEKADILVSELLGSFGDNELSPECLDGAQHLLKESGVSIPCNSISYLRPVMSKKLHDTIMRTPLSESCERRLETAWQVYLTNAYFIDKPKEVFKFVHPNTKFPINNARFKKLEFNSEIDCLVHGFSGYFTSELYKGIELSIHPDTHTKGMISWFSIFFPLPEPMPLKKGDRIELVFWRKCNLEKVWYEYQVVAPALSQVVNEAGKYHPLLL